MSGLSGQPYWSYTCIRRRKTKAPFKGYLCAHFFPSPVCAHFFQPITETSVHGSAVLRLNSNTYCQHQLVSSLTWHSGTGLILLPSLCFIDLAWTVSHQASAVVSLQLSRLCATLFLSPSAFCTMWTVHLRGSCPACSSPICTAMVCMEVSPISGLLVHDQNCWLGRLELAQVPAAEVWPCSVWYFAQPSCVGSKW